MAAAILPNRAGSSTRGVMKSAVLMIAASGAMRQTAASSLVSNPTSRFGSCTGQIAERASDRSAGPIFAAQPQVRGMPVCVLLRNGFMVS